MSILLATTKTDGHQTNAESTLPALITLILTPRSHDAAHGRTVRHIFETDAFKALPHDERQPVIDAALPSIRNTDCPACRRKWLDEDPNLENRSQ